MSLLSLSHVIGKRVLVGQLPRSATLLLSSSSPLPRLSNCWSRCYGKKMLSTLPRLPVFEAIAGHSPQSTVVVHSNSGRRFQYGELLGDVRRVRNRLYEASKKSDLDGERIAFLVENSYDYVGKPATIISIIFAIRVLNTIADQ